MERCPKSSDAGTRCQRVVLFFFWSSAENPVLEGVISIASVHFNLATVQPQTEAASGILQEVVL